MIGGRQLVRALDNATSIVVITDVSGTITFVNKTFETVYGYSRQEAIGNNPSLLKSGYHAQSFYEEMWNTLTSGNSWHGDFINQAKSGDLIIEKASISPVYSEEESSIKGFIAVKEDISVVKKLREQLQKRNQLFERLFEKSPEGILILDPKFEQGEIVDFIVVRANPRGAAILGLPVMEQVSLKKTFRSSALFDRLCASRKRGDELLEWMSEPLQKSLQLRIFPISSEQDCLMLSDVSVEKEMEEKLLESEAHLRMLNDTKDKFFSIIAHDLKNPFQVIIGFASLLNENLESFGSDEIKAMVQKIIQSSENTYQLLEDLLTWAKSQLGQLTPYPDKCDIHRIIDKAFLQLGDLASRKGVELKNEVDLSSYCTADRDMMEFVMRNLIHNGIKFTPIGGYIRCWCSVANGQVQIKVEDTGIGIQPAKLNALFSLDDILSTHGTSEESGTGLGLILIREMVDLNKGSIEVSSTPGRGSCFSVQLPSWG